MQIGDGVLMPEQYRECPVCNITWEGDEIPDGLMKANPQAYDTRDKAEEAARSYGWTSENKAKFSANVIAVEYAYDDPDHYDGISEWRCLVCESRIGRWSGKVLGEEESEPVLGLNKGQ